MSITPMLTQEEIVSLQHNIINYSHAKTQSSARRAQIMFNGCDNAKKYLPKALKYVNKHIKKAVKDGKPYVSVNMGISLL